jgi:hypothetical protein
LFVPVEPGPHFDADPLIELAEIRARRVSASSIGVVSYSTCGFRPDRG